MSPERLPSPLVAFILDSALEREVQFACWRQLLAPMPRAAAEGAFGSCLCGSAYHYCPVSVLDDWSKVRSECSILNAGQQLWIMGLSLWSSGYLKYPFLCNPGTKTAQPPAFGG